MITYHKPKLKNIPEMMKLVEPEIEKGVILYRSAEEMANTIRSYCVAQEENKIVGFCALHIYSQTLAEVRSLIVAPTHRQKGVGRALVEQILQEGKILGIQEVLTLTYQEAFFKKMGFERISREEIPHPKVWADCIKCKKFFQCDEIALLKKL